MTKEQYLRIRPQTQAGNLSVELLYEMYTELRREDSELLPIEQFEGLMHHYMAQGGMLNRDVILRHFDQKFQVMSVINSKNQIIRVL